VDQRQAGAFPLGTLTAFREGRQTHPVPDGTCDITAHVALDACAAAAEEVTASVLTTQRSALRALGVHAARPPISRAAEAPASYLRLLAEASAATELLDPAGLGSFGWLVQTKDVGLPASLATGEQNSAV
jgi:SAM-dependent MidA family methyltransferase